MKSNDRTDYERRICRAVDFVNAHLSECPSVAEIANAAPFSSFHFQRLFRAFTGESVAEFTRRLRLETAARRLKHHFHGDITALAFELGFSSSQNFAKAFKQHFGKSPTQFLRDSSDRAVDPMAVSSSLDKVETGSFVEGQLRFMERQTAALELAGDLPVTVAALPEYRVAYKRHVGSYTDPGVQVAFNELVRWARLRGLDQLDRYIGIPWDDAEITEDKRCRFDACLVVSKLDDVEKSMNYQTIPKGRYAVYQTEVVGHDFDLPWTRLMRDWLPQSTFQPADGPRYERYLSDGTHDPDGKWSLELFLPIKPL